jgi:hypothetical protein
MAHSISRAPRTGRQLPRRVKNAFADATAALGREARLRKYAEAYAALRENPEEWAAIEAERRAFDGTLMDGLRGE